MSFNYGYLLTKQKFYTVHLNNLTRYFQLVYLTTTRDFSPKILLQCPYNRLKYLIDKISTLKNIKKSEVRERENATKGNMST